MVAVSRVGGGVEGAGRTLLKICGDPEPSPWHPWKKMAVGIPESFQNCGTFQIWVARCRRERRRTPSFPVWALAQTGAGGDEANEFGCEHVVFEASMSHLGAGVQ